MSCNLEKAVKVVKVLDMTPYLGTAFRSLICLSRQILCDDVIPITMNHILLICTRVNILAKSDPPLPRGGINSTREKTGKKFSSREKVKN